ncbi:hypothetical protein ABB55_20775 [Prosthecomicrobium hirschii]|uniref:Sulfotransferase domain-containing protein n=1 Tax=Prosthecodimorpha hirschii TaxID=665126 RepID=A0A0P6VTT4_9HYPH|nr:hypothetical protein [Prosthecomicrobium hirschii]KPL54344.1 hypothetical protein ABB55_20775 [Prosthecomicrobium hirschii]
MSELFLHIGMSKTGSTSIQGAFHAARGALIGHGYDYLDMGQNHSRIIKMVVKGRSKRVKGAAADRLGLARNVGGFDVGRVAGPFMDLIRQPKAARMIMSGEGLFRVEEREADGLHDVLSRHFERIRIVAYLRDPFSWASSRAQENIKHGHPVSELAATVGDDPASSPIVPNYRRSLERFIERFGRDAVDLRLFDRRRMVGGDLIADFAAAIGAGPEVVALLPRPWNNPRTSAEAAQLIEQHYIALRRRWAGPLKRGLFKDYDITSLEYWFRKNLRERPGPAFTLPRPLLERIWQESLPDVEWLRGEMNDPSVFADCRPPDDAPAVWSSEEKAGEIARLEREIGRRRRSEAALILRHAQERRFGTVLADLGGMMRP